MELVQKELEYWLASTQKLGPVKTKALLDFFGSEEAIYGATKSQLQQVEGITEAVVTEMLQKKEPACLHNNYKKMEEKGIYLISVHDKEYPERLQNIEKPPYALFCRGKLPVEDKISIAIVGARNCSAYGKEMALWFGRELSNAGIQVISGLAFGIDGYAHQGALHGQTPTFGVLGNGIDICYPKENFSIYMKIQERGGVLSEYSPGTRPATFQFPMRNRIISGLSDAVLVVEARERSGSLITADLALDQGKDIFAIPGRIGDNLSSGCNNLIKQGAQIVLSPTEIVENFHLNELKCVKNFKKNNILLDSPEKIVYASLGFKPKHLDEILAETSMLMSEVIAILLKLELDGYVKQTSPNCYIRQILET